MLAPLQYQGAIQRVTWHVTQAEELQRLEAERTAILTRRAPRLLQQPTADGAHDAHGATGDLTCWLAGCAGACSTSAALLMASGHGHGIIS